MFRSKVARPRESTAKLCFHLSLRIHESNSGTLLSTLSISTHERKRRNSASISLSEWKVSTLAYAYRVVFDALHNVLEGFLRGVLLQDVDDAAEVQRVVISAVLLLAPDAAFILAEQGVYSPRASKV